MGVWDVETQREETAEWGAGSTCEKCGVPFFWNVKEMWAKKAIGVRQVSDDMEPVRGYKDTSIVLAPNTHYIGEVRYMCVHVIFPF